MARKIDINAEKQYENMKVLSGNVRAAQGKFYWATEKYIKEHHKIVCKSIEGLSGLEIGCSSGKDALKYSDFCSSYTGIDISDEGIKKAQNKNIPNCTFICTDGHKIPFDDESFDFVIVNSLLHHLDIDSAFKEINRVLNKNGKLIFREPLGINPFFKIYRNITPRARTDDEKPFDLTDIKLMQRYFNFNDVKWYGFLNIISGFVKINAIRNVLSKIDDLFSKTPFKYLFWQFSGIATKKNLS